MVKEMDKKAWQYSKLDKSVTDRFKKLGDIGESVAVTLLQRAGFINVENLNSTLGANVQFFDIQAERKKKYVISVKARNKFENSAAGKKLNSRYKLFDNPSVVSIDAKAKYGSEVAWVTVAVDIPNGTLDAYFGTLASLDGNKKGVPMTNKAVQSYECLTFCCPLEKFGIQKEVYKKLANTYKKRSDGKTI
jgi:hypothetical protein